MVIALQRSCPWASSSEAISSSISPYAPPETLLFSPRRPPRSCPLLRASIDHEDESASTSAAGRRQTLLRMGGLISLFHPMTGAAFAAKAPGGYQAVLDSFDKYQFLYPFGWQEVSVTGQDCVYKDVIEPLESVSVNIIGTNKSDIRELGSAQEVANTMVKKALTSSSQKAELVEAKERVTDGKTYYTFEFVTKAPNYTRHGLGTVTIAEGKFFTLTTGANERRWGKMQDKLKTVANSFTILK